MTQEAPIQAFGPGFVLDLNDPAFIKNPYPTYRWLRENAPAYDWPGRAAVVFTRYKDVKAILNDRRFSNDYRFWEHAREEEWPPEHAEYKKILDNGLFSLPDADHVRVRKLVSGAFTPRAADRMRGEVKRTVDEIINAGVQGDKLDITTITEPLPIRVISDMLKIPQGLRAEFRAFAITAVRSAVLFNRQEEVFASSARCPGGSACSARSSPIAARTCSRTTS